MKLNYLVISTKPELVVKFFYEGEYDEVKQEYKRYGEFYIRFNREAKNLNNPTDFMGVRGMAEVQQKDPDYALSLLQGLADTLGENSNVDTRITELPTPSVEDGYCEECGRELPEPVSEDRGGGYSELITYCKCGATYHG